MIETKMDLHGGYAMTVVGTERSALQLRAPDGRLCVTISLSEHGPAVEVRAGALQIATEGDVDISCDHMRIAARGDISLSAGGELTTEGDGQRLIARAGNVDIEANDDVSLHGERVRLNTPPPTRTESAEREALSVGSSSERRAYLTGRSTRAPGKV